MPQCSERIANKFSLSRRVCVFFLAASFCRAASFRTRWHDETRRAAQTADVRLDALAVCHNRAIASEHGLVAVVVPSIGSF